MARSYFSGLKADRRRNKFCKDWRRTYPKEILQLGINILKELEEVKK